MHNEPAQLKRSARRASLVMARAKMVIGISMVDASSTRPPSSQPARPTGRAGSSSQPSRACRAPNIMVMRSSGARVLMSWFQWWDA